MDEFSRPSKKPIISTFPILCWRNEVKCTELLARVPPLEVGEGYCIAATCMTHKSLLLELGPNSRDPGHGCRFVLLRESMFPCS